MLVLGPEVLELEQDPLRVVEGLHPRVAQARELLAKRLRTGIRNTLGSKDPGGQRPSSLIGHALHA